MSRIAMIIILSVLLASGQGAPASAGACPSGMAMAVTVDMAHGMGCAGHCPMPDKGAAGACCVAASGPALLPTARIAIDFPAVPMAFFERGETVPREAAAERDPPTPKPFA